MDTAPASIPSTTNRVHMIKMLPVRPLTDDQQRSNTADRRKYMAIIMAITHLLIKEAKQQLNITAAKSKWKGLPSFGGQKSL